MNRLPLIIALLFLAGCTPPPSSHTAPKTVQMRHSAYLGKKIGIFILGAGMPYAKKISTKKVVYAWNSKRPDFHLLTKDRSDDRWMDGICEIRIHTRPNGIIYAIYALEDSSKDWSSYACADYLK